MPVTAEGSTMRSETLWGLAPSASPASRRVLGTLDTAISVEMTITGSISTASANDPAIAEKPTCRSWTTKEKANRPMRIDGAPAMVWAMTRSDDGELRVGLGEVDPDEDTDGNRHDGRVERERDAADDGVGDVRRWRWAR